MLSIGRYRGILLVLYPCSVVVLVCLVTTTMVIAFSRTAWAIIMHHHRAG